ncbi:MAG: cell filamentation protein Fic [Alcanivorax sp.]|nr:cell filamentation protein Fic [Alcanivorax sp.]MAY09398.1 cell filamentation protein Fic [Alcanivorax sp.]MBI55253.1 cell filamentation protein Fic [Alcanivorax sp.]MBU59548.1 cell filamentation protein Fic [Alcanivorax sp.]MBU60411.1 cell filamentation protein Fic [Alcanivorax sp.]
MNQGRYDTAGSPEGEWEPGSEEQVLANQLGVTNPCLMDQIELDGLNYLYQSVYESVTEDETLGMEDIIAWHREWLGGIYAWAGQYRTVNMSKNGFPFAAAAQLPRLAEELDQMIQESTPCLCMTEEELVAAIARTHVEFVLVHPFREGNGRIARLLADIMALQAGKAGLDFSSWDRDRDNYFAAIQQGLGEDYGAMEAFVSSALRDAESDVF